MAKKAGGTQAYKDKAGEPRAYKDKAGEIRLRHPCAPKAGGRLGG